MAKTTYICPNCGKDIPDDGGIGTHEGWFCNKECIREWCNREGCDPEDIE